MGLPLDLTLPICWWNLCFNHFTRIFRKFPKFYEMNDMVKYLQLKIKNKIECLILIYKLLMNIKNLSHPPSCYTPPHPTTPLIVSPSASLVIVGATVSFSRCLKYGWIQKTNKFCFQYLVGYINTLFPFCKRLLSSLV